MSGKGCWSFILTELLNSTKCLTLDVIQVLLAGTINLVKVHTVPCMFTAALSLSRTASRWQDRLAHTENITDAYSQ